MMPRSHRSASTSQTPTPSDTRRRIVIFTHDPMRFEALHAARSAYGAAEISFSKGDLTSLRNALEHNPGLADVVGIELLGDADQIIASLSNLMRDRPQSVRIIGFGDINEIGFYRSVLSCGLDDYFALPLTQQDVDRIFTFEHQAEEHSGTIIGFLGLAGGVGTTTIALNFATTLPQQSGQDVAFVDATFQLPLWRNLIPAADAARTENSHRDMLLEDRKFSFDEFIIRDHVKLISPFQLDRTETGLPDFGATLAALIEKERRSHSIVIVDAGNKLDSYDILSLCDHILLVAEPDFNSFSRMTLTLASLSSRYPYAIIDIGLTQIGAAGRIEFSAEDIQKETGRKPILFYRCDHRAVSRAMASGLPVLHEALLKERDAFKILASQCGIETTPRKSSLSVLLHHFRNWLGLSI